jgi:hypothetical protein
MDYLRIPRRSRNQRESKRAGQMHAPIVWHHLDGFGGGGCRPRTAFFLAGELLHFLGGRVAARTVSWRVDGAHPYLILTSKLNAYFYMCQDQFLHIK